MRPVLANDIAYTAEVIRNGVGYDQAVSYEELVSIVGGCFEHQYRGYVPFTLRQLRAYADWAEVNIVELFDPHPRMSLTLAQLHDEYVLRAPHRRARERLWSEFESFARLTMLTAPGVQIIGGIHCGVFAVNAPPSICCERRPSPKQLTRQSTSRQQSSCRLSSTYSSKEQRHGANEVG